MDIPLVVNFYNDTFEFCNYYEIYAILKGERLNFCND
jgi:hypothetical protein